MSKITKQNVGGTDYTMVGCALTGVCASAAADYVKVVTLSDGDELSDGMTVIVAFANGNTAGTAPASMTIYSSDQVNYYTDAGLTTPFTLAPAGCYEITYTGEGNAYNYVAYPVMQVGSVSGPLCDASGNKASGALWLAGDKVSINYANGCFSVIPQTAGSLTVTAASSVVNGAPVRIGSTVRVLFTQDLTGVANAGLVLTYNGVSIPVMVGKNGSLGALLPFDVGGGTYKYLQAYTTLEMTYDGTQFIVLGNPVVISNSDYTVYTDGSTKYNSNVVTAKANKQRFKKNGGYISNRSQDYTYLKISFDDFVSQSAPYYGTMSCLIVSNAGDIGILTLCRSDTFYVNFYNIAGNTHLVYNSLKNNKDIYFSTDVSYPRVYTVYDLTGFGMSLEGVNSIPS